MDSLGFSTDGCLAMQTALYASKTVGRAVIHDGAIVSRKRLLQEIPGLRGDCPALLISVSYDQ